MQRRHGFPRFHTSALKRNSPLMVELSHRVSLLLKDPRLIRERRSVIQECCYDGIQLTIVRKTRCGSTSVGEDSPTGG